ncbi:MAG: LmeA family phospholipid-binding protein [bacterium]
MRVYIYVLLSALFGLSPFRPIEKHLENRFKRKVEGLEEARVKIYASRFGFLFTGFIRKVIVELSGLRVGGLRTEAFIVKAKDIRFRPFSTFIRGRTRVRNAGDTTWLLRIQEGDFEDFFNSKGPLLGKMEVKIDGEWITLRRTAGIAKLLSLEAFNLRGRLTLSEQKNVMLELDHVSAFGISPGRPFRDTIMGLANPLIKAVDINRLIKRNPIEVLEGVKPHTILEDIRLSPGQADVLGEIILLPDSPSEKNAG